MKLNDEIIKALNFTVEDAEMFKTPFKDMTKEGIYHLFALADKVHTYNEALREQERQKEKLLTEEERIHLNKDLMFRNKPKYDPVNKEFRS